MNPVFLDTGWPWILDTDDPWHAAAENGLKRVVSQRQSTLTTRFILLGDVATRRPEGRTFRRDVYAPPKRSNFATS